MKGNPILEIVCSHCKMKQSYWYHTWLEDDQFCVRCKLRLTDKMIVHQYGSF